MISVGRKPAGQKSLLLLLIGSTEKFLGAFSFSSEAENIRARNPPLSVLRWWQRNELALKRVFNAVWLQLCIRGISPLLKGDKKKLDGNECRRK